MCMSLILTETSSSSQDLNNIRRAYKVALDAARRIKVATNWDVFSIQQKQLRQKLRDNVRRCLLAAPAEYGPLKLEDTAWKYSVHIVIQKLKRENRGSKSAITQHNVRSFLESTYGWYMSFMFQLMDKLSENGGAENIYFDWWSHNDNLEVEENDEINDKNKVQQILLNLCYKCLLYLGDLCRYQNDLFPESYSIKLAYRYYMQAWHMFPSHGMPWNQIGSLVTSNYHGVLAIYFYRRCLQSEIPYNDCYQNLKRLFDRSKKSYLSYPRSQMDNISINATPEERKQAVYWFSVVFTHLSGMLRPATYCTERELNTACRRMLDLLELCLYFNDDSEVENDLEDDPQQMPGFIKRSSIKIDGPAQISSSFLVVVFGSMVQAFDDLRKIKSNRTKAANALFMAAADHLVTHAISQLKDAASYPASEDSDNEVIQEEVPEEPELVNHLVKPELNVQKQKPASSPPKRASIGFMRRRRALLDDDLSEGESDLSEVSEEDDIDEEIIYESDSASLYSQEMDSDEEPEIKPRQSFRNTNNNTNHPKDTIIEEEESDDSAKKEPRKLACSFLASRARVEEEEEEIDDDYFEEENDRVDEELIFEFEKSPTDQAENGNNGEVLDEEIEETIKMEHVVNIFENFTIFHPIKIICDWLFVNDEIVTEHCSAPFWARLVHLVNLLDIDEMIRIKGDVSEEAKNLLKGEQWLQCFSLWEDRFLYGIPVMADCHDHVDYKANPNLTKWEENLLRLGLLRKFLRNIGEKHPTTEITMDGELFIGKDIQSLEDDEFNIRGTFEDEKQNGDNNENIVVPTPEALANNLENMKLIVEDQNIKTIITNITFDGLDQMKKESRGARDVTRWLDTVFSRCIGNVQSMQQTEQRSIQRLRRNDSDAWILQHLVNIGTKLHRQKKQVILLVDSVDRQTSLSVKKALQSASANGLMIQTVEDFVRLRDYKK